MAGNAYEVHQSDYGSFGRSDGPPTGTNGGYGPDHGEEYGDGHDAPYGGGSVQYGGSQPPPAQQYGGAGPKHSAPLPPPPHGQAGIVVESSVRSNQSDGAIINSRDSPNNTKMFVGGISKSTSTNSLRQYFEAFGEVRDVEIKVDPQTGQSRGFGFVLFLNEDSVQAVVSKSDHFLDGKKIDPKRAEKRNAKIFVGGLKAETTDETIQQVFGQYGEIELFERRLDKNKGTPQAFCFITFKDDYVAQQICKNRWVDVEDKKAECKIAVENKQKLQGQGQGQGGAFPGPPGAYAGNVGGYGGGGGPAQRGGYGGQSWGGGMGPYSGGAWGAGWGPNGGNPYGGYGNYGGGPSRGGGGPGRGGGGGPMRGGPPRGRGRPTPY